MVLIWIALVLGCSPATWAVVTYLALAAIGLPILSGFYGGWEHFVGPTAGFLFAFPVVVYVVGKFRKKIPMKIHWLILAFLAAHVALLLLGAIGLAIHEFTFSQIMAEYYGLVPGTVIKSVVGATLVRLEFLVREMGKNNQAEA